MSGNGYSSLFIRFTHSTISRVVSLRVFKFSSKRRSVSSLDLFCSHLLKKYI